jgi:hypothetical protein
MGVGIYGLEHSQCSVHDLMCYYFVCAFLHSLSADDRDKAVEAVHHYMSIIVGHALEAQDDALTRRAFSNWKLHLIEAYGGADKVPQEEWAKVSSLENQFGSPVEPGTLEFPVPGPWALDWATEDSAMTLYPDGTVDSDGESSDG